MEERKREKGRNGGQISRGEKVTKDAGEKQERRKKKKMTKRKKEQTRER